MTQLILSGLQSGITAKRPVVREGVKKTNSCGEGGGCSNPPVRQNIICFRPSMNQLVYILKIVKKNQYGSESYGHVRNY